MSGAALLQQRYAAERERLLARAADEAPAGEYASPVFGEGAAQPTVMFVGEAPGAEETRLGRPFVGRAGRQLDALLLSAAIDRSTAYVTNVVKYRPVVRGAHGARNRTPGRAEVTDALPLLLVEIQTLVPQVIVTLGNVPLGALLALADAAPGSIGSLHGRPIPLRLDGAVRTLFPLYHPASAIYNRSLLPVLEADVRALGEHLVKRVGTCGAGHKTMI